MRRIILVLIVAILLGGCGMAETPAIENNSSITTEVSTEEKIDGPIYVVTINVSQHHPFWEVNEKIKDNMNDIEIDIPTSKEFYDSVEVGTVLNDSFRWGSFWVNGSYGNWNVTIMDKKIEGDRSK